MRVGVVLSGCGMRDGSEIHEATLTLLALDRAGATARCLAPDIPQSTVVDHYSDAATNESRQVLHEAARIARGKIQPLSDVVVDELDAVILPGGYGAALNLCTFGRDGPHCTVHPQVASFLRATHAAKKPIGAICIAPVILAKLFGNTSPQLTIGNDTATAAAMEAMGATHQVATVGDIVIDTQHKFVTTPAYMLAQRISEVNDGIDALVQEVLAMVRSS